MGLKPLSTIIGELKIVDLASKGVKSINKELEKSKKNLKQTERQTKKTDREIKKLGRSFKGIKSPQIRGGFSGFGGRAGGGGGGGAGVPGKGGGVIGKLGVAGAVVGAITGIGVAAIGNMSEEGANFAKAITLEKELKLLSNNFRAAFKDSAKNAIKKFTAEGFFRKEDIQAALTGLTDLGISSEAIQKNAGILKRFTKAQGLGTLSEGISALAGGDIKLGRGVSKFQRDQIKAFAPLLENAHTAGFAFEEITRILKESRKAQKQFSEQTTKSLKGITVSSNAVIDTQQNLARSSLGSAQAFFESARVERLKRKTQAGVADVTVSGTKGIRRGLKAAGGAVKSGLSAIGFQEGGDPPVGKTVIVGERGPELFTPKVSGTVHSNRESKKLLSGGQTINQTNNITISVPLGSLGTGIKREVEKALNVLGRTTFRYNTGMALRG